MTPFLRGLTASCSAFALGLGATSAMAREETSQPTEVETLTVWGRGLNLVGVAHSGSEGVVGYRDLELRPLLRVGELVETVPGLIATQHSGTGKANQYFLRGFNLDHGTDLAGYVDGAPINLRTHGHGQGYLDFNFLIPELVERIDYRKGPYYADVGDFTAAGTVAFTTYDTLPAPFAEATIGQFGYYRGVVVGSQEAGSGDVLAGVELVRSNGPWDLDEDLTRFNGLVKYSQGPADRHWSVAGGAYVARWNATDQVPLRAIQSGLISRRGNVDPDLGGKTTRLSATAEADVGSTHFNAYAIYYDFRLTSDFTYFLEDPINGDEFQQRDRRGVFGGAVRHSWSTNLASRPTTLRVGADARYDDIGKIGLYRSVGGRPISAIREDQVQEASLGGYAEAEVALTSRLRAVLGLRADGYDYDVSAGVAANSGDGADAMLTPKAALAWRTTDHLELYANYGEGFHSNDVRGAAITVDPVSGDPVSKVDVLVRSKGAELGGRFDRGALNVSLVAFWLDLGSELVFVGDAGATEPSDASRRYGVEFSSFWRPAEWLTFDLTAAHTHARLRGVASGEDRIAQSVASVVGSGATVAFGKDLTATLRVRHFGSAPLIEDGSVRSEPTTLVNLGAYYTTGKLRFGLDVYNLFDARDADISYYYESRLAGEAAGVEDVHLRPVEPLQARFSVRRAF
jgi:outer membrane receptor protein involved in Fe transport